MFKVEFHSVEECMPPKSGDYLVLCKNGYGAVIFYSQKHRKFNVMNLDEETDTEIKADYWAELPPFVGSKYKLPV